MPERSGTDVIRTWPDESREAAQLVIDANGSPQEATDTQLTWHRVGPWKRIGVVTTTSPRPARNESCSRVCARAATEDVVLADGFSCRVQIEQGHSGGHHGIHLAELLADGYRRASPRSN